MIVGKAVGCKCGRKIYPLIPVIGAYTASSGSTCKGRSQVKRVGIELRELRILGQRFGDIRSVLTIICKTACA